MRIRSVLTATILGLSAIAPTWAQAEEEDPLRPRTGEARVSRWRIGMIVKASGGTCRDLSGYVPVPADWPEQHVAIVEEDFSPEVKVTFQNVDGVTIMNVQIPRLDGGREARAVITIDVRRSVILPPRDTNQYFIPDAKKLPDEIRSYLAPSPKVESRDPKIVQLASALSVDKDGAWERVEAIYKWVSDHVKYQDEPLKGALAALNDRTGDCEERSALFIALCRAAGVPARTVWVPDHCYSEFYLVDDQDWGHWFPCQSAGTPNFGEITEFAPILQKGDNFRPPKPGMARQRYMAEFFAGMTVPGGGKPQVEFVREEIAN
jgi:transglutaminase-like putative cysteine protease